MFRLSTWTTASVKSGHQYVVAIGIDHYENWPVLSTAVSDATGFAKLLTSKFGFEYAVEPLTEKNATRDAINALVDDDLRGRLKPEDSLVIFFAGHGTTRNDKIGDQTRSIGFIVPVDAHADAANRWSDYLNVEEFLRMVSTLPAAHILVILDSCHSGMALGSKFSTSRDDTRFQRDMLVKVSRKVISSASGDQLAADQGPLPESLPLHRAHDPGADQRQSRRVQLGLRHLQPARRLSRSTRSAWPRDRSRLRCSAPSTGTRAASSSSTWAPEPQPPAPPMAANPGPDKIRSQ